MREVYVNGKVYTGNNGLQEAFIVKDGIFEWVGSNEAVEPLIEPTDTVIDLAGKFVCSGFNDSHMHLLSYGNYLMNAQLDKHTDSLQGMLEYLKEFMVEKEIHEGEWIKGRGFNQDYFSDENRMPTRHDLDTVSTKHPILISRACGHLLVVNTKALEILGIESDDPNVSNGVFYDDTMSMVSERMPIPSNEELKKMILAASKSLNSYGITSSQTDDYCVFTNIPGIKINEVYEELNREGLLTVRVNQQANITSLDTLQQFIALGNTTGAGDLMYKIGPLKMLGDGSLGARTASLSVPYNDDPSTQGMMCFADDFIYQMVLYAHTHGMQAAIHAIGDHCLDVVLNAYEKVLQQYPREEHRHGIVHCQISREEQLQKIIDLNLHIYAQSIFIDYDTHIVYERVGEKLANTSYYWKHLKEHGVHVSNGTDCPVELPDALACMQCAITRESYSKPSRPFLPDQAFTVAEALDSYTIMGAYASFEENIKGYVSEGYLADYVILEKSPFEVDPHTIKDIQVNSTYLNGKCVYQGGR
ncbi:MAG: amidohydrolase [Erysipelotrichales bacterium]|nr:amidohydrolase [Erysipelotrichales bacterium]